MREPEPMRALALYHAARAELFAVADNYSIIIAAIPDIARRATVAFNLNCDGELEGKDGLTMAGFLRALAEGCPFFFASNAGTQT